MKRKILNERCIHKVQWFLGISCVIFLSACGEERTDHGIAADIGAVEEEQASQESEQEDVKVLAKFLIVWDQNGEGRIVKWWIEPW